MGPSYFVTYGGDRLTFGGTPGSIAWEQKPTMVLLNNNLDYLKMRFVTPNAEEIIIEDGNGVSSASAYVPSGSTAYWTGHGYEDNPDAKYFVSGLNLAGFDGVSADTSVSTSLYENPVHSACGSAVLTANDSASARVRTWTSRKATFGEGGANYYVAFSASSFLGNYVSPLGLTQRTAWIPHGSFVRFSASSVGGATYSMNPSASALDNFGITWNHKGPGSVMDVTGKMNTSIAYRLGQGRTKNVYATGTAYHLATASAKSASVWRAYTVATAFSSNLNTGSAIDTYLNTTAGATGVNGLSFNKALGQMKNSAGTWIIINGSNDVLVWKYASAFMTMSATMSGSYSAVRAKGGTGNTTATAIINGYTTASGSYSMKSATFKAPTASGNTATTTLSISTSRTDGGGANQMNLCNMFQSQIAQNANLWSNCRGAWTASGRVV